MDSDDGVVRSRGRISELPARTSGSEAEGVVEQRPGVTEPLRRAWFRPLGDDRYGVFVGECRVGFIDVDGPLHVALRGHDYETAVEVDRAIRFDQALRALLVA